LNSYSFPPFFLSCQTISSYDCASPSSLSLSLELERNRYWLFLPSHTLLLAEKIFALFSFFNQAQSSSSSCMTPLSQIAQYSFFFLMNSFFPFFFSFGRQSIFFFWQKDSSSPAGLDSSRSWSFIFELLFFF